MRCLISGQSGSRVRRTVFGSTRTNRQAPAYVPWPGSPHRCPWRKALPCAVVGVPSVLSQQVFQDHIIKHLIGQKSLQPGVFGLEALQFASVADVHPAKSGFPFIKSRRADPVKSYSLLTPADLFGLHPAFLFRQNRDDLVSGAAFAPQTVTYNSVNFDFLMPISLMMDSPFKQRTNRGAGHDVIADFDALNNFEKIDLSGVNAISDFADLVQSHLSDDTAGNAVISVGVHQITLSGVNMNDLDANDFIFG